MVNVVAGEPLAVPVKVLAAPLVGSAVDDEHVTAIAAAAAAHDPAGHAARPGRPAVAGGAGDDATGHRLQQARKETAAARRGRPR